MIPKSPRYAYGDMVLFGSLGAILGYGLWGLAVGVAALILIPALVVVATELGHYPHKTDTNG